MQDKMLESYAENLAEMAKTNIWLAPLAALVDGLLTAAIPCVFAAAPLMVGYVAGQEKRTVGRSFLLPLERCTCCSSNSPPSRRETHGGREGQPAATISRSI